MEDSCPGVLKYEITDENEVLTIVFTLDFDSFGDYYNKCRNLLDVSGAEYTEPIMVESHSGDSFLYGMNYEEYFSDFDLLGWLEKGLLERGIVPAEYADKIFSEKKNKINVAGDMIENNDQKIKFENVGHININRLLYYTTINYNKTFNRIIEIQVAKDSSSENASLIAQTFLHKPGFVLFSKEEFEEYDAYRLAALEASSEQIDEMMKYFSNQNTKMIDVNIMDGEYTWKEKVDFSNYLVPNNSSAFRFALDDYFATSFTLNGQSEDPYVDAGYASIGTRNSTTAEISYTSSMSPTIRELTIDNSIKKNNVLNREIYISGNSNTDAFIKYYTDLFNDRYGDIVESIQQLDEDGKTGLLIKTKETESKNMMSLYDSNNQSLKIVKKCYLIDAYCKNNFEESFDPKALTISPISLFTYRVSDFPDSKDYENVYMDPRNNSATVSYSNSSFNLVKVILYLLLLALVGFIVVFRIANAIGSRGIDRSKPVKPDKPKKSKSKKDKDIDVANFE